MPRCWAIRAAMAVPTRTPSMIIRLYHRRANGPMVTMTGSMSISTRGMTLRRLGASILPAGPGRLRAQPFSALVGPAAQVGQQVLKGQGVQHVPRLEPGPPGDLGAVVQVGQLAGGVGVRVDHQLD